MSVSNRHCLEPKEEIDNLAQAIDDISGIYPIDSRKMYSLMELLKKNKNASMKSTLQVSEDAYITMLSAYEVGLDACETELEEN